MPHSSTFDSLNPNMKIQRRMYSSIIEVDLGCVLLHRSKTCFVAFNKMLLSVFERLRAHLVEEFELSCL